MPDIRGILGMTELDMDKPWNVVPVGEVNAAAATGHSPLLGWNAA
jgi:hypothetical protein